MIDTRRRQISPAAPEPRAASLLRPRDASEYLSVGVSTFYRLRRAPGFPSPVEVPGLSAPRYRREDIDAWVRGRQPKKGAAA